MLTTWLRRVCDIILKSVWRSYGSSTTCLVRFTSWCFFWSYWIVSLFLFLLLLIFALIWLPPVLPGLLFSCEIFFHSPKLFPVPSVRVSSLCLHEIRSIPQAFDNSCLLPVESLLLRLYTHNFPRCQLRKIFCGSVEVVLLAIFCRLQFTISFFVDGWFQKLRMRGSTVLVLRLMSLWAGLVLMPWLGVFLII